MGQMIATRLFHKGASSLEETFFLIYESCDKNVSDVWSNNCEIFLKAIFFLPVCILLSPKRHFLCWSPIFEPLVQMRVFFIVVQFHLSYVKVQ